MKEGQLDLTAPDSTVVTARDGASLLRCANNTRAAWVMIAAIIVYGLTLTAIKLAGDRLPTAQIFFITEIIPTLVLGIMIAQNRSERSQMRSGDFFKTIIPGLFATGQLFTLLIAIRHVPLAEVTALGFSEVIFLTFAAALFLNEVVSWQRWVGTAGGFIGILIILRPTGQALNIFAAIAILSAVFDCAMRVSLRKTEELATTATIVSFYTVLVQSIACAGPALFAWVRPTPFEWGMVIFSGVLSALLTYLMTTACRLGEASMLAPLDFARLVVVTIFGYLLFHEIPDLWMAIGALIVVLATAFAMSGGHDEDCAPAAPTSALGNG